MTEAEIQLKAMKIIEDLDKTLKESKNELSYIWSIGTKGQYKANSMATTPEQLTMCFAMAIFSYAKFFTGNGFTMKQFGDIIEEAVGMAYALMKAEEERKGNIIAGPWGKKMGDTIVRG